MSLADFKGQAYAFWYFRSLPRPDVTASWWTRLLAWVRR